MRVSEDPQTLCLWLEVKYEATPTSPLKSRVGCNPEHINSSHWGNIQKNPLLFILLTLLYLHCECGFLRVIQQVLPTCLDISTRGAPLGCSTHVLEPQMCCVTSPYPRPYSCSLQPPDARFQHAPLVCVPFSNASHLGFYPNFYCYKLCYHVHLSYFLSCSSWFPFS